MVFDVYSAYVNNFTEAMETAKKLARQKPAFSEFLKVRFWIEQNVWSKNGIRNGGVHKRIFGSSMLPFGLLEGIKSPSKIFLEKKNANNE